MAEVFDLLVVGGGINGVGIARDAAGRGLSVVLVEREDLAQHTSSASTKLIHGGLRYLEHGAFRLVREGLTEREVLLAAAPHLIRPLRFVLPQGPGLRPGWLIRLGLFLYDHLGRRSRLEGSFAVRFPDAALGQPLRPEIRRGFVYADCRVDDSRLVVANAIDAAERGATILTRTAFVEARRDGTLWHARLGGVAGIQEVVARAIVNAAGPWVDRVLHGSLGIGGANEVRLVKGSHIVVPRLYDGDHAYLLQNADRRIVFAIPYEGRFTLVGTTDVPFAAGPGAVAIDPAEIAYLCASLGCWFRIAPAPADIVWSYAGIRPLHDDAAGEAAAVTRDYALRVDGVEAPVLSVYGGKITTYRRLAEHALERLLPLLGRTGTPWTARATLPGGDLPGGDPESLAREAERRWPFLPAGMARRLAAAYGTRIERILGGTMSIGDLGEDFGGGLFAGEVDHLLRHEWARTAEDILWRRSKLGLHVPADTAARLDAYLGAAR
ncbi:MAG TPA: glycerol-3-phosphate dehydrogenase [Stellaceae bacterium]|nr:glycerol-3-phosphate dehydrogenase [Stellaceae bacterium]